MAAIVKFAWRLGRFGTDVQLVCLSNSTSVLEATGPGDFLSTRMACTTRSVSFSRLAYSATFVTSEVGSSANCLRTAAQDVRLRVVEQSDQGGGGLRAARMPQGARRAISRIKGSGLRNSSDNSG